MAKKIASLLFILAALGACAGRSASEQAQELAGSYAELTSRYDRLKDQLNEKMKSSPARPQREQFVEEFNRMQGERKRELEALLQKSGDLKASDALDLVRSKIMIEISRFDDAEKIIDRLGGRQDGLGAEARLQKVVLHLIRRNHSEAARLFREIEAIAPRDDQFYDICLALAFSHPETPVREEFSQKLIDMPLLPRHILALLPRIHANLAMLAKENRQIARAGDHFDKALALVTDPALKTAWESERKQLTMIDQPPPPLDVDNWLNSQLQSLDALKGKVVVIDFWAPWCNPCRKVMPALQEQYRKFRDQGLLVIGYTRLYGRYSDDLESKPQVDAEEELTLIRKYVERNGINYPIAVSAEGRAFDAYGVTAIPTMVFIDRSGKIDHFKTGTGTLKQIEEKIAALVARK